MSIHPAFGVRTEQRTDATQTTPQPATARNYREGEGDYGGGDYGGGDYGGGDVGGGDYGGGDYGGGDYGGGDYGGGDVGGGDYGGGGDVSGGDYGGGGDVGGGDYGGGDVGGGGDYGSSGDYGGGGDYGASGGDVGGDYGSSGDYGAGGDYGSGDAYPSDSASGDAYPSDSASGDAYPSDSASGDAYPSDSASGDAYPSDSATGDAYPSDTTSGDAYPNNVGDDFPPTTESGDAYPNEVDVPGLEEDFNPEYGSNVDVPAAEPALEVPADWGANPQDLGPTSIVGFGDESMNQTTLGDGTSATMEPGVTGSEQSTTQVFDDGSTLTTNADGTTSATDAPADPQPTTQTFDDGSTLTTNPDGTTSATEATDSPIADANGDGQITDADVNAALANAANDPNNPVVSETDPSFWEQVNAGQVPGVEPAFMPRDHLAMTNNASVAAGFNQQTADAFASAARAVDYQNFNDEAAHSNAAPGQTPEQAAQTAIDRATQTGNNLATALDNYAANPTTANAQTVVQQVGAINHQLQDAYAHQGMTFDQHAAMDGQNNSPDRNPAALAEATTATNQLMQNVAQAMQDRGINPTTFNAPAPPSQLTSIVSGYNQWGGMAQYGMNNGSGWNGQDTRWPAGTNQQIQQSFTNALNNPAGGRRT